MANVQRYFEKFHEVIRADYDMNATLAEKRDIILERIRADLKKKDRPLFERILQGSYIMKTGVAPIADLEFDIDVGLKFAISRTENGAEAVRAWVFEAVDGHTDKVEAKSPCIRVAYTKGYHVDLVTYAVEEQGGNLSFHMAHEKEGWIPADPVHLLEHVDNARVPFADLTDPATRTDQFRRAVRCLKRWNDVEMPTERGDKPSGLAFVLLCCNHLRPTAGIDGRPDDRSALWAVTNHLAEYRGRIVAMKPTPQYEDMLGRLTEEQMTALKGRFRVLADALQYAATEPDIVLACERLRSVFGRDFPVPSPEESGKKASAPAIITSSSSAR